MIRIVAIACAILAAMWFVDSQPALFATLIGVATAYGFYKAFKRVWWL